MDQNMDIVKKMQEDLDEAYALIDDAEQTHDIMAKAVKETGKFILFLKTLDETNYTANAIVALEDLKDEMEENVRKLESKVAGLEGKVTYLEKLINDAEWSGMGFCGGKVVVGLSI